MSDAARGERVTWVTESAGRRAVRSLSCVKVEVVRGPDRGQSAVIRGLRFRIGALPGNDLVLTDTAVSGHHVELLLEPRGHRVRDLGSRNGTFLGTTHVLDGYLSLPGRLTVGNTELQLSATTEVVELPASADERFGPLLGRSVAMREVFARLQKLAPSDSTVLISGETGTGKEVVAEALVQAGPRADGPLVVVDCGALSPTLAESELFGHEKGAFTGAVEAHAGAFERAHGGTVFLDEIGELPLELQPKLLRVLERREVQRVGGKQPKQVDVRILAATHRELEAEVNRGQFRADLFYRLSVLQVHLPALRERAEDVPLLVAHFLQTLRQAPAALDDAAMRKLGEHSWPGNVRELRNAVERLAHGVEPLKRAPLATGPVPESQRAASGAGPVDLEVPFLEQKDGLVEGFERRYAEALLKWCDGNLAKGARKAGLSRMAVVKMMSRLGFL